MFNSKRRSSIVFLLTLKKKYIKLLVFIAEPIPFNYQTL